METNQIKGRFCELPIESIVIPEVSAKLEEPGNPRQDMGQLFDLSDSVKEVGMLQPIVVNRVDGKNILVIGERRVTAAKDAGLTFVEAKVFENLDAVTAMRMTIAGDKHKTLNPIEEARGMRILMNIGGYTVKKLAREYNMVPETITRKLKLLDLPEDIQQMVKRDINPLPAHQALMVLKVPKDKQKEIAQQIAPSTGPVLNEQQAKEIIDTSKGAKLIPDGPDPADKMPTLPGPDKKKTNKKAKVKSPGFKPVTANIGIKGKLFITVEGIEIRKATLTVKVDKDVKIIAMDCIKLPDNSDILKLINKHHRMHG